ncbi:ArnT family glycosyltransferase [Neolewinella maritima]|nr:glycosyltransferase family 39 protein [Neolewinella maritima]
MSVRLPRLPPFWFFLLLAVALRWGSFFVSVIDHDESTYIVIADELLRGKVYLRDVVDTKPIGIFWIYALLNTITGGSIPLLRLATTVAVALGSWGLFVANLRAMGDRTAGYVAGVLYVLMCSIYAHYGMAPNTEHYFNALTIWAVAISVAAPRKRWGWAGLLLGLAFIIKPFAAAEAGAVGLFLVWHYRNNLRRMIGQGLLLVGTWALPVAGVVAYYWQLDLLPALYFYSVEVAGAYPIELPWYLRLKYMGDYLLRYSPFILAGGAALVRGSFSKGQIQWLAYLLLHFVLVTFVILITGKRYGHYQVQLHPVVALWVGATAGLLWREVWQRRGVLIGLGAVVLGIGLAYALYYGAKEARPEAITAYLRPRLQPGETFFAINGFQITYHLLDRPLPTPYAHPSLLYSAHHAAALEIDEQRVAQSIIDNPRVKYLVGGTDKAGSDTPLTRRLLEHFRVAGDVDEEVRVWVRK